MDDYAPHLAAPSDTVPGDVPHDPSSAAARALRIAALKTDRDWTWARVAQEVGVSQGTVESWVYRRVKPSFPHLRRLAQVFDVSIAFIETGEPEGEPADPVAALEHRMDMLEGKLIRDGDLAHFVRSNAGRIDLLEQAITRVESSLAELRELMEGTATAVKALRTGEVAPPQPEPAERQPREKRATGGRRQTDPDLPPGR